MKKIISTLVTGVLAAGLFAVPAMGDTYEYDGIKLPFELTAPTNVSIVWLEGGDSENTCEVHYNQNNSMSEWSTRKGNDYDTVMEELADMGYDDVWITAQIDWSIDATDDWHYNKYWDTDGYDEEYIRRLGDWAYFPCSYSADTTNSEWIFRWMGNIEDPEDWVWHGVHDDSEDFDGWKDVLKEGQYEIISDEDGSYAKIDFTKHTLYVRVRWLVYVNYYNDEDGIVTKTVASEWSEPASVGKDAAVVKPVLAGDVAAPEISDLRFTDEDFNGFPVVAFKLEVDDELQAQLSQLSGTQGYISLEIEARVKDGEWVGLDGDWIVRAGEMEAKLQHLGEQEKQVDKDTPIELRTRYYYTTSDGDDCYSDYSNVLTFGSEEMGVKPTKVPDDKPVEEEKDAPAKEKKDDDKCGICGFCPQPLGLCIFIWIAIAIIIIAAVVIVIVVLKKKDKKEENN